MCVLRVYGCVCAVLTCVCVPVCALLASLTGQLPRGLRGSPPGSGGRPARAEEEAPPPGQADLASEGRGAVRGASPAAPGPLSFSSAARCPGSCGVWGRCPGTRDLPSVTLVRQAFRVDRGWPPPSDPTQPCCVCAFAEAHPASPNLQYHLSPVYQGNPYSSFRTQLKFLFQQNPPLTPPKA